MCHALISHWNNQKQLAYCISSRSCTKYCVNSLQSHQETVVRLCDGTVTSPVVMLEGSRHSMSYCLIKKRFGSRLFTDGIRDVLSCHFAVYVVGGIVGF